MFPEGRAGGYPQASALRQGVRIAIVAHAALEQRQAAREYRMLPLVLPQIGQSGRYLQTGGEENAGAYRRMRGDPYRMSRGEHGDAPELGDTGVSHFRLD